MKPLLAILGTLFILGIVISILFFILHKSPQQNSTSPSISNFGSPPSVSTLPPSSSQEASSTEIITQAFQTQLPQFTNDPSFVIGKTVIISPYAIQIWNTTNESGEALFQFDPSKGWVLLSAGGGVWTVSSLINDKGVPQSIAEQLVAGLQNTP